MAKKKVPPAFLANIKKAKAGKLKPPSKKAAAKGGRKSKPGTKGKSKSKK